MQSHEERIGWLEGSVRHAVATAGRADERSSRAIGDAAGADEQARKAAQRVDSMEHDIRRLDAAREFLVEENRNLRLGLLADAKVYVLAIGVLALVSLIEAVAIVLLWRRE